MGPRIFHLHRLLPALLGVGLAQSQTFGNRVEQLHFQSPLGDTLFLIRFQESEGGQVVRSHYDENGFLLFRALSGADAGVHLDAAGDTLYRIRRSPQGDSTRMEIADGLGRALIGATYLEAGSAGTYGVVADSLVGKTSFRYFAGAHGRTDSIHVSQDGGLTHVVKVAYGPGAGIGGPRSRLRVLGFRHEHPGRVRLRFASEPKPRKISAVLHRLDGSRAAELAGDLPAGATEYGLDIGSFPGTVPSGVHGVRFFLDSEEMFRFKLGGS